MSDEGFTRKDWLRLLISVAWLVVFAFRPQLILAVTLLLIGSGVIAFNAAIVWYTVIRKEKHASSIVPVVGGIAAAGGIALLPLTGTWQWAWIPLLLDCGGLPMFLCAFIEKFRTR